MGAQQIVLLYCNIQIVVIIKSEGFSENFPNYILGNNIFLHTEDNFHGICAAEKYGKAAALSSLNIQAFTTNRSA